MTALSAAHAQAQNLIAAYIDIEHARRVVAGASGFAAAPLLQSGKRSVHPNEVGFAEAEIFDVIRKAMVAALEERKRPIYACLTGPFKLPPYVLKQYVTDALGPDPFEDKTAAVAAQENAPAADGGDCQDVEGKTDPPSRRAMAASATARPKGPAAKPPSSPEGLEQDSGPEDLGGLMLDVDDYSQGSDGDAG